MTGKNRPEAVLLLLLAPVLLVTCGCATLRLPAIDPSGRRIFLPSPNSTTLAGDGFLSRFHNRTGLNNQSGFGNNPVSRGLQPLPGPYEPALLNRQRGRLFNHDRPGGLHDRLHNRAPALPSASRAFGTNPAFVRPSAPPLCGPDGLAPDGSPCYPVGSPTQTSLNATLPGTTGIAPIGSGLGGSGLGGSGVGGSGIGYPGGVGMTSLSPGVVLQRPQLVAAVGEEVVVVGGVRSPTGVYRANEPVRWTLSNQSVGTILDANDASRSNARHRAFSLLRKTEMPRSCGDCVYSTTSARCDVLARSLTNPGDDIFVSRGQTWATVVSGTEGISYLTLAAPQLDSWNRRHATAKIVWVDGNWQFPAPVQSSLEGPGQLVTRVARKSDGTPLPNWLVRYQVLDGPPATFNQTGKDVIDVPTDAGGRAIVNLFPTTTEASTTRVRIQVIKPGSGPDQPEQILIGDGIGYVTWVENGIAGQPLQPPTEIPSFPPTDAPTLPGDGGGFPGGFGGGEFPPTDIGTPATAQADLAIDVEGPTTANVGAVVPYTITLRNRDTSQTAVARNITVRVPYPAPGLTLVDSNPRPTRDDGSGYVWELAELPPGRSASIQAQFRVQDIREYEVLAVAVAENANSRVDDGVRLRGIGQSIGVQVSDPRPYEVTVGDEVVFEIAVENRTDQQLSFELRDTYEAGLEPVLKPGEPRPETGRTILIPAQQLGPLAPNSTRREGLSLPFRALAPGTWKHSVEVITTDGERAIDEGIVVVRAPAVRPQPSVRIDVESPPILDAGATDRLRITVTNDGNVPQTNGQLQYQFDEDLLVLKSTEGFEAQDFVLTWPVKNMDPGTQVTIELDVRASESPRRRAAQHAVRFVSQQADEQELVSVEIRETASNGIRGGLGGASGADGFAPRGNVAATGTLNTRVEAVDRAGLGQPIQYQVIVENGSDRSFRDVYVVLDIAPGMEFLSGARGPTQAVAGNNGLSLQFNPVYELRPGEPLTYFVQAAARERGTARLQATVTAAGLSRPAVSLKQTTIN